MKSGTPKPQGLYRDCFTLYLYGGVKVKVKVKQSRYRPGVAQRVPRS